MDERLLNGTLTVSSINVGVVSFERAKRNRPNFFFDYSFYTENVVIVVDTPVSSNYWKLRFAVFPSYS